MSINISCHSNLSYYYYYWNKNRVKSQNTHKQKQHKAHSVTTQKNKTKESVSGSAGLAKRHHQLTLGSSTWYDCHAHATVQSEENLQKKRES